MPLVMHTPVSDPLYSACPQGLEPAPPPPALPPPHIRPLQVILSVSLEAPRAQTQASTALEPFMFQTWRMLCAHETLNPLCSFIPHLSGLFLSPGRAL